jgi:hypothetical protein
MKPFTLEVSSGNVALLTPVQQGNRIAVDVAWVYDPTPADIQECDAYFAAAHQSAVPREGRQLSCDYQGYEFGARYPDSVCIDGYLWNADSGDPSPDGDGWCYTSGGELPCPLCHFKEAVARLAEEMREEQWVRRYEAGRQRGPNHKLFFNRARRQIRAYLERHGLKRDLGLVLAEALA